MGCPGSGWTEFVGQVRQTEPLSRRPLRPRRPPSPPPSSPPEPRPQGWYRIHRDDRVLESPCPDRVQHPCPVVVTDEHVENCVTRVVKEEVQEVRPDTSLVLRSSREPVNPYGVVGEPTGTYGIPRLLPRSVRWTSKRSRGRNPTKCLEGSGDRERRERGDVSISGSPPCQPRTRTRSEFGLGVKRSTSSGSTVGGVDGGRG